MDRNHAEIRKRKTQMVINYKRLNNNTYEDQYEIPGKDQLINCIHNTNIFSKFDSKSGF